jgi:hypothetical protein
MEHSRPRLRYYAAMQTFDADLAETTAAITRACAALLDRWHRLSDDDLARGRRGGWTVRHVRASEVAYTRVAVHCRSITSPVADVTDEDVRSISAAERALTMTREAPTAAVGGVEEAAFYDLRTLGHEQYSVLSVLENAANHDREHLDRMEKILHSVSS